MCAETSKGIIEDMKHRNLAHAFPAEVSRERNVELRPLDEPNEDDDMCIPGELPSEEAEREQEFSDKLLLPGMTTDMQETRA